MNSVYLAIVRISPKKNLPATLLERLVMLTANLLFCSWHRKKQETAVEILQRTFISFSVTSKKFSLNRQCYLIILYFIYRKLKAEKSSCLRYVSRKRAQGNERVRRWQPYNKSFELWKLTESELALTTSTTVAVRCLKETRQHKPELPTNSHPDAERWFVAQLNGMWCRIVLQIWFRMRRHYIFIECVPRLANMNL